MRIVILGTSSAIPTQDRGLSAIAIRRGGELLLFDVGEGTQRALIKAKLGLNRKMKIFITHLHGDHCIGLIGLFQTMSMVNRDKPLDVYGPKGLMGFVKSNMKHLRFGLTYPLSIHEIKREGIVVKESDYTVKTCKTEHSVLTYAYLLQEKPRPGIFNPKIASKLGVPEGKLWSRLQHGRSVMVGSKLVKPSQVMNPKRGGRTVGISGDTRPAAHLSKFFSEVDVLIFDSTYGDDHMDKAIDNTHSTAREAATVAFNAEAKLLALTHFSSRYDDVQRLVKEAMEVHPKVVAAHDMMTLDVLFQE